MGPMKERESYEDRKSTLGNLKFVNLKFILFITEPLFLYFKEKYPDDGIYWHVNFERFHQHMFDQVGVFVH